jgi:predicted nucleic acid-binding protein
VLSEFATGFPRDELAITAMTAAELIHAIWRSNDESRRVRRQQFFDELFVRVPVYPMTLATAKVFGKIDGELRAQGIKIPDADLIIGATALELGFAVATANVRHFRLIPHLKVHLLP